MKNSNKTIILLTILAIVLTFTSSCTKKYYGGIYPTPCDGNCEANYTLIYKGDTVPLNQNGHYEVEWDGLNYFQVHGKLKELREDYVINKVPLISSDFDTDYWVLFDTLSFNVPMYSYLGWFNDQSMNTPISIGNHTYTMKDLINLHPPYNIAGYQIPKHFCYDCPYAPTIVGSHSRYTYYPIQNFLLDDEMVGDTINIFIETIFNTDIGNSETLESEIKVIVI
jgi:hypothetical protein